MTPAALSTFRVLRTLNLRPETLRKIRIASSGRPSFSALSDEQFDAVMQEIRRKYPLAVDLVRPSWPPRERRAGDYLTPLRSTFENHASPNEMCK
jgi:hypothetical protein